MSAATIEFHFDSITAEERFLREYLFEAWNRFESSKYWETGWFWPYGSFAQYDSGPDAGLVKLVFEGDPETLVVEESDHWDKCNGLASWRVRRYEDEGYNSLLEQQKDAKGEIGGEWEYRIKPLISRFSLAYRREFEESLPAVGQAGHKNPKGIGFWAGLHDLLVQCGYDWYDETNACQKAMKNRIQSIALYRGASAARDEYERLLAEWQGYEDELDDWLDENPTGEATEP